MSKPILFVSQYVEPNLVGGNNNVYRQAKALKHDLGVNVDILTWPAGGDAWTGPVPAASLSGTEIPFLTWAYDGLNYHVVQLPEELLGRVLKESEWENAVAIGCELLRKIDPAIVHLQHWRGLWWILESANRLAIPTVYTPHDWGMGCLRTILVKGEGGLCDGSVSSAKCTRCIWRGRNLLGKLNELVVSTALGEALLERIERTPLEPFLARHGAVRLGLRKRFHLNNTRAKRVLSRLSAIIVPNQFAKTFFLQFGIPELKIHVEPWYYDLNKPALSAPVISERLRMGFIGRISPEKGVQRIFDALLSDDIPNPIHLVIAGEIQGEYARGLHARFKDRVGKHSVEWLGFIPHEEVHRFYTNVDVVIISSECIENGPLTLVESFAFKCPVIMSDTPTARNYVEEGQTGYFYTYDSTASLVQAINRAICNPGNLLAMRPNIPTFKSSAAYGEAVRAVYERIVNNQIPC